jgi:hypothetical protein
VWGGHPPDACLSTCGDVNDPPKSGHTGVGSDRVLALKGFVGLQPRPHDTDDVMPMTLVASPSELTRDVGPGAPTAQDPR